jgi:hypothetical protein
MMIQAVIINKLKTANLRKALAEPKAQKLEINIKVKYLELTGTQKTIKVGKLHRLLLIDVGKPGKASTPV